MRCTFERFPDDPAARRVMTEIAAVLCDAEELCWPAQGDVVAAGKPGSSRPGSAKPKGDAKAIEALDTMVRSLKRTLNGDRGLTGLKTRLSRMVERQQRKRRQAVTSVGGIDVRVIKDAMPKDAVALTAAMTPEERSERAKRAAAARWAKHRNLETT